MALVGAEPDGTARFGDIAAATQFDPSRLTGEDLYGALLRRMLDETAMPS